MPKPKVPPAPRRRTLHLTVRCATEPIITFRSDAAGVPDGLPAVETRVDRFAREDAWKVFIVLHEKAPDGWNVHLTIGADGYQAESRTWQLEPFVDPSGVEIKEMALERVAVAPALPRLVVDGLWFTTDDGQPWTQIGCSDFRLLQRFMAGEDIEPILTERALLGFNQLRVFLMCDLMFHFYPQEHPDYIAKLQAFLVRLAAHGLRAELTVMVDATRVMPDLGQQQRFFVDVCAGVHGLPHVFVELVNENEQTINTVQTDRFSRPSGVICSHGSKGVVDSAREAVFVEPAWDYASLHPDRDVDWPRNGHNIDEDIAQKAHVPGTINESCRPDQGRGPIASDFFDAAANIALMGAGGTFHSDSGKFSRLFTPDERQCAIAWVAGARAVPLWAQRGRYIAGHLTGYPIQWHDGDSARAHGRMVGNRAVLSLPQMHEDYRPVGIDGWRVVKQTGSVVECER